METMSHSSSSLPGRREASTFDELYMQQSLLFSDSLKDLKNLRSQLYSAAEYFELSYANDDQKQIVVDTLKDYAVKALVNTVDHLGSVSYKVNGLLHERASEVSSTEFRVSCIEQRLRTCQERVGREGRAQQSLVIAAPKFHKRYILPVSTSLPESGRQARAAYQEPNIYKTSTLQQKPPAAVCSSNKERPPSFRKLRSLSTQRMRSSSASLKERSGSPTPRPGNFSAAERKATSRPSSPFGRHGKYSDKRAPSPLPTSSFARPGKFPTTDKRDVSPLPSSNPFARSGSFSVRPNLLNSSSTRQRFPSEPQKSASMRLHAERDDNDTEQNSGKSKSFLKSLLTRRRSRKDETLYNYLDGY